MWTFWFNSPLSIHLLLLLLLLTISVMTLAEVCVRTDVCRCETASGAVIDISKIGKIIHDNNPENFGALKVNGNSQ